MKVLSFWGKKKKKFYIKKVNYIKRKKVAEKKLRIKGRFVTKDQAMLILGSKVKKVHKQVLNQKNKKVSKTRNQRIRKKISMRDKMLTKKSKGVDAVVKMNGFKDPPLKVRNA